MGENESEGIMQNEQSVLSCYCENTIDVRLVHLVNSDAGE